MNMIACGAFLQAVYQHIMSLQMILPPITRPREVDFGPPIRKATCYLYNLPEVESTFETMRVPTVSARFSTAPFFWNWAMIAVARLAPRGFLEDRAKCTYLPLVAGMLLHPTHAGAEHQQARNKQQHGSRPCKAVTLLTVKEETSSAVMYKLGTGPFFDATH